MVAVRLSRLSVGDSKALVNQLNRLLPKIEQAINEAAQSGPTSTSQNSGAGSSFVPSAAVPAPPASGGGTGIPTIIELTGDVTGSADGNTVSFLQDTTLTITTPVDGDVIEYDGGSTAFINKPITSLLQSFQSPAFVSPYTPDIDSGRVIEMTLTAGLTVNAPTSATTIPNGTRIDFILVQDGTGGWTVTWDVVFLQMWSDTGNTLNKRSTISFVYDGTNWNQLCAQSPYY